jgi:protein SCO1
MAEAWVTARRGVTRQELRAMVSRIAWRWPWIAMSSAAVLAAYQLAILVVLSAGLGGRPNYWRAYPAWENARRIAVGTPSWTDIVTLLGREPLAEYGRLHPYFRAAVWSFELTWASLLFFLSFSLLLGVYLGLGGALRGWRAVASRGGAGIVGMLGASVSLTHCGLGSFGVVLALVGVSTATIAWFARLEPVLIPAGYALMLAAIVQRAAWLDRGNAPRGAVPAVMRRASLLALVGLLVVGCRGAAAELPSFALTDQAERPLRAEQLRGRVVVLSFIFTTCVEACPIITAQLVRVQAQAREAGLASRLRFVSVSIDPLTDTPERLREYAKAYGADLDSWLFLTGPPEEIARLMHALRVETAPGRRALAHDTPIFFVDPRGRVSERQDPVALVPDQAIATLRRLAS